MTTPREPFTVTSEHDPDQTRHFISLGAGVRGMRLPSCCGYDRLNIKRVERLMSKTYLPCDPDQQLLLPAALQEWLPD